MSMQQPGAGAHLSLENPRSVAIYDTYEDAQMAVDYLADHKFPVDSLMIVGTDLKSIERVTGALSWGKVLATGAASGVAWGLLLAVLLWLFLPGRSLFSVVAYGLLFGVLYGMVAQAIQYGMTRGQRDFSSRTAVIATHYEVLGEATVYTEARQLLGEKPENWDPSAATGQAAGPVLPSYLPQLDGAAVDPKPYDAYAGPQAGFAPAGFEPLGYPASRADASPALSRPSDTPAAPQATHAADGVPADAGPAVPGTGATPQAGLAAPVGYVAAEPGYPASRADASPAVSRPSDTPVAPQATHAAPGVQLSPPPVAPPAQTGSLPVVHPFDNDDTDGHPRRYL